MTDKIQAPAVAKWIHNRSGRIFGFPLTPATPQDIADVSKLALRNSQQLIIAHQNLHGLYLASTNDSFRQLHEKSNCMVHIDGFPIVYLAWLHGLRQTGMRHRAAIHDWLPGYVKNLSNQRARIYCLGSNERVCELAVARLSQEAPGAIIQGRSGYFDATRNSAGNEQVLKEINHFNPDILIVGMGMGRQEQWILENSGCLGNTCIVAVGACLEYMAGEMRMSPRWFGPFGLEMLWRLGSRPRRYAHRYLVEPWLLLTLLIKSGRIFGKHS